MCEKEQFIRNMKMRLATMTDSELANDILDMIVYELQDYDLAKRSTELVVYEQDNDKIIKSYVACLGVEGKSKKTAYQYRAAIKRMFAFLGNKKYDKVTAYDIRAWLASIKMSGCKNTTLSNYRNYIKAFYGWLYTESLIEKNPCDPIKPIKVPEEEKHAFSSEEIDTIRSNCDNLKERALIEFSLASGLRAAEICNLKIEDVDFDKLIVHVKAGKGNKDRTVFINPVARKYVLKYIEDNKYKSVYVFTSKRGNKYSTSGFERIMQKMTKRCGFHVHLHRFRRTLASDLARKGMPIQEIQKLLGHTSIETTRKYIDTRTESVEASYRQYVA